MQPSLEVTQASGINNILAEAEQYAARGQRERAYQLSLKATQINPAEIEAWRLRADTAPSLEERLVCLSRLYSLSPNYHPAKRIMYSALRDLLYHEPFLAYLDETEELYRVKSGLELYLNVPKSRAVPETYPSPKPDALRSVYSWVVLAAISLFIGGVGAFFLAPLASLKAFLLQAQPLNRYDRLRALVALALAILIWLASIPIGLLFVIHIVQ